ncbi:MAG TPA: PEP-CTERM sorting domain-containing protein [Candidatus Sulfopaludibacter sp.]|nr:PEP-CTERM sorting domain-containing protein [Candidatus Sulfopaludibacter sp.]
MKICKESFASKVWLYRGFFSAILLGSSIVQSMALVYTINSGGYAASYDSSQNGFTSWTAGGANQLALQTLYYSLNGGPVTQLTGAAVSTSSGFVSSITAAYSISAGISINDVLTLNGGTLGETIQFNNLSGSTVNMRIFQYSDFVLGGPGAAGNQTVNMTPSSGGGYAIASQTGGGLNLVWQGDAPGYNTLVEANGSGAPFGAFIGSETDLNNTTLAAINTFAVFGYEFSGSVTQGTLLSVSETAAFPVPVPEPSALALMASGMFVLAMAIRQRKAEQA